ncbi:MAG TPA: MBL fold metallo-hydrolase [Methylomirabilota bacterium]|nr:MBL fold metallo-hydrolase [Methylomirabilota bacterium]
MASIPLEDSFVDILGKAQRGLKLTDEQIAAEAGVAVADWIAAKGGRVDPTILRRLAATLRLAPEQLIASAQKAWYPQPVELDGLAAFNTTYEDMTVNSYLVWDPATRAAAAFDTGGTCAPMLETARRRGLKIQLILLTHTHVDHIADLDRLKAETGATVHASRLESVPGAATFPAGHTFAVGGLQIETRQTTGHSVGGTTYVIRGLARPVAVVGDALFAGSMGGGGVSYADALASNRAQIFTLPDDTVICPGHGPLTTVAEEMRHNPFYPEFKTNQ